MSDSNWRKGDGRVRAPDLCPTAIGVREVGGLEHQTYGGIKQKRKNTCRGYLVYPKINIMITYIYISRRSRPHNFS